MGFFDFLKPVEKAGGATLHFLGNALVPGAAIAEGTRNRIQQSTQQAVNSLPAPARQQVQSSPDYQRIQNAPNPYTQTRDLAVGAARGIARVLPTIGVSAVQKGSQQASSALTSQLDQLSKLDYQSRKNAITNNPGLKQVLSNKGFNINDPSDTEIAKAKGGVPKTPVAYTPGSSIEKAVLGTEPVQSYQQRTEGNKQVIEGSRFRGAATPLAFLGAAGTIGGDITGLNTGEGALAKETIDKLTQATTQQAVKKILGKEVPDHIAQAIANNKDPNVIENILKGGSKIPKEVPPVVPPAPPPEVLAHVAQSNDIATTVPRSGVKPFSGSLDAVTEGKLNGLVDQAKATPVPAGKVRVFQAVGPGGTSDYVFKDVDNLAAFKNNTTHPNDTFNFKDVSPNDLAATPGKPGVFQVKTPFSDVANPAGVGKPPVQDLRSATIPSASPVQKVVDALNQGNIEGLQKRQQALYSTERSSRLANSQAAAGDLTGREATYAQLGALKGKLPRVDSTALKEHLSTVVKPEDVNGILDTLRTNPNLSGYEPITAQNAVVKLFDEGKLPTPSEFDILQKSLGSDFTDSLKTTAVDSMSSWQKVKNFAVQVLGAPKSVMASFDLSGGGRQGAVLGSRFLPEWGNAQKESVKMFASTKAYESKLAEIASRENAPIYKKMGLNLASAGAHEEQFASTLAEKIPIAGRGIAASDRAYTGGLTVLRADAADHILNDLKGAGIDPTTLGDKQLKSIGQFINTASGRGNLGALEKHAQSLGEALFSPRLWKSRLDMLNPVYYAKLDPIARKYALQSAASFASIAGVVLGLAAAAGAKVETDARSSDFLKIKVGDTRYDILGGFQQNLVLADREIFGQKKSSVTGAISDLNNAKFGSANRLSVLSDFIQNKENPVISTGQTLIRGTDKVGNPINPATEIAKLAIPLNIQDTYQTAKNTGSLPEGLLKATIPGSVGVGVGTYGTKDIQLTAREKATVQLLQKKGAPKGQVDAYTTFYQISKTASGKRANVSDAITQALENNDIKKAQQLASDYNKEYSSAFKQWNDKYKQYSDKTLTKEYNANRINLTSASIKSRIKAIKNNPINQVGNQ